MHIGVSDICKSAIAMATNVNVDVTKTQIGISEQWMGKVISNERFDVILWIQRE